MSWLLALQKVNYLKEITIQKNILHMSLEIESLNVNMIATSFKGWMFMASTRQKQFHIFT